eukprot:6731163-Prymnesium_polylepis.2
MWSSLPSRLPSLRAQGPRAQRWLPRPHAAGCRAMGDGRWAWAAHLPPNTKSSVPMRVDECPTCAPEHAATRVTGRRVGAGAAALRAASRPHQCSGRRARDGWHSPQVGLELVQSHVIERLLVGGTAHEHQLVAHHVERAADARVGPPTLGVQGAPIHRHEDVHVVQARLAIVAAKDEDLGAHLPSVGARGSGGSVQMPRAGSQWQQPVAATHRGRAGGRCARLTSVAAWPTLALGAR